MKVTIYSFALIVFFLGSTGFTYAQTDSAAVFDVAGNCGLCKKRIENAATLDGVEKAVWDMKTHRLTVKYNYEKTSLAAIQQSIAHAGHDTPLFRAPDEVYEKLHECCLYERLDKDKNSGEHQYSTTEGEEHDHDKHDHIITGVVVNESGKGDLTPIVGVNVVWLEDPIRRETSNENGVFKIKHEKGNKNLIFSYAGMQSDTIEVKDLHEVLVVHAQNNVLSEVVVSRKKKSTYIDALTPTRVEVLTARELFKAACCDLSESFETNVSVDVVSNDAVTGSKQIQMLGLSGIYTQLTVENLPGPRGFATPLGLNSIAGTWINSIEISKGIGSVVNGFENMAGQINVELKKPQNSEKLFFNAYANNMGRTDINLNLAHKINSDWSVGFLLHDNFMYNKNMNFSENGFRDVPVGNLFSGINRWNYENGKGTIIQFGVKYLKDDRTGGEIDFNKDTDRLTRNKYGIGFDNQRIEGFAKIGYVFPENRLRSIGLQLSGSNYTQDSYFGQNTYNSDQRSGYANLIFQDVLGSVAHKYKLGTSVSYDDYQEEVNAFNYDRKEVVSGAFAEYTFSPSEKFDAVLGLRQDYNSLYGWFTTPRAVLRYTPVSGTTLRLSSGRGQRTANIFAENISVLASSRNIDFASYQTSGTAYNLQPEVSWNTGLTLDQNFQLFGRESGVSVELFHNNFLNQVVVDYEDSRTVSFYNLDGKSYSNSLQAEFRFMPARHFETRMAYRMLDVETDYSSGRLQKPLTAKHRGFMNLAYNLHSGWSFDYTLNMVGQKRLPSTVDNPVEYQLPAYSQAYVTMNAQISKSLGKDKNFDIYVGGENLSNYYQKNPILAFDDPFGDYFDTGLLWGPLTGRMFYTGVRYHIK
ncbi:TonB-dependent receptor plug domain-containing protein [Sphingobacterium sp. SGG-5]|uniref:cation transporter n=1 Tax=Sphingobacterium sp. SGG-5 TaxID=2710881 RepID=UPI0013EA91CF|nr:cation transporter [Sphingobacterium sp. SGG-5]NGM60368.1 TonB-dependent receptor plug domain-containing protein [Sphingobacterium sp. SGG-5]